MSLYGDMCLYQKRWSETPENEDEMLLDALVSLPPSFTAPARPVLEIFVFNGSRLSLTVTVY